MNQFLVTGMSCAACSARVERAVSSVEGVTSCSVNLLTGSMVTHGSAPPDRIIAAVRAAGYGAVLREKQKEKNISAGDEMLIDRDTPVLKRRLVISLGFLLVLMYVSMGHNMAGWPLPEFLEENPVAQGILQMLLAAIVMVINQKFFINGAKGMLHRAPNMDTLVAMGSGASFLWSVCVLFAMSGAQAAGDQAGAASYLHEFYFEASAMILTLITVGKMLEARAKGRTTDALKGLMKLAPDTAVVIRNGAETQVPREEVEKGELFVLRPGETVPVDGVILEGCSAVNEAALTGESIPSDKEPGGSVYAGTINVSGFLKCEAVRVGEDTTLAEIIELVSDAAAGKAPIAKIADRVSGIFVPAVIAIAGLTLTIWLAAGQTMGYALARAISVLVISCPCALGLATPVAIMVGSGKGAGNGILFKTAASLEETGKIQIVVLDKTGTITAGEPKVTDILPAEGISEQELLILAGSLESKSEHPLAGAILKETDERQLLIRSVDEFHALPGNGLSGKLDEQLLCGGNRRFIEHYTQIPMELEQRAQTLAKEGKTPLYFCRNQVLLGVIAVADVIREDSPNAVKELKNMGIHVVMLTGDREQTAKAIGKQAGVDEVVAGVLPEGKEAVIRKLQETGKVAMVGDGINDAPALTRADIGIAIGAGTDIAIDAADVVLMKNRLSDAAAAIRLSRAVLRGIKQNLFWAFFYNVIGIPLAAGLWIPVFGWKLNPMFGAAAMSLSSFCVVTNALRLNLFPMYDAARDRKIKTGIQEGETILKAQYMKERENNTMEKTMVIEGMMCMHCEARVKKTLEALPGVDEAVVSYESGTAMVKLSAPVDDAVLKAAVEAQDYPVISVSQV